MSVEVISRKIIKEDLPEDEFTISGPYIGTVLRQIFADVEFPITDVKDLLEKAGSDRLIYLDHEMYGQMIFSLADILDAIPETVNFFPINEKCEVVDKFMLLHRTSRKKGLPTYLSRINNKNLLKIISKQPEMHNGAAEVKPYQITERESPLAEFKKRTESLEFKKLNFITSEPENQKTLKVFLVDYALKIFDYWQQIFISNATEKAIADANAAEQAAIKAEQVEAEVEQGKLNAASDDHNIAFNGKNTAHTKCTECGTYAAQAQSLASSSLANASIAGTVQAYDAANRAALSTARAQSAYLKAQSADYKAQVLYSIQMMPITVHVLDDDSCSGKDNVANANVSVKNVTYPEVMSHAELTGSNGRATIWGKFGPSMAGSSKVLIIAEKDGYQNSTTRIIYGTSYSLEITLPDYDA